jgi:ATP-dependent Clp protease protease subunit
MAASMAAVILACGTKGKRYILPHSEVLIHQPSGGMRGQATDIERYANHIVKTKKRLNKLLAEQTGQTIEKITVDTDRDFVMVAEEAVEYGIVDKIVKARPKTEIDD